MEEKAEEDPFESLTKLCQMTPSQEETLEVCPIVEDLQTSPSSLNSQNSSPSSPNSQTSSPNLPTFPTSAAPSSPSEPLTAIAMVSLSQSALIASPSDQTTPEFQTPPEGHRTRSHSVSSQDYLDTQMGVDDKMESEGDLGGPASKKIRVNEKDLSQRDTESAGNSEEAAGVGDTQLVDLNSEFEEFGVMCERVRKDVFEVICPQVEEKGDAGMEENKEFVRESEMACKEGLAYEAVKKIQQVVEGTEEVHHNMDENVDLGVRREVYQIVEENDGDNEKLGIEVENMGNEDMEKTVNFDEEREEAHKNSLEGIAIDDADKDDDNDNDGDKEDRDEDDNGDTQTQAVGDQRGKVSGGGNEGMVDEDLQDDDDGDTEIRAVGEESAKVSGNGDKCMGDEDLQDDDDDDGDTETHAVCRESAKVSESGDECMGDEDLQDDNDDDGDTETQAVGEETAKFSGSGDECMDDEDLQDDDDGDMETQAVGEELSGSDDECMGDEDLQESGNVDERRKEMSAVAGKDKLPKEIERFGDRGEEMGKNGIEEIENSGSKSVASSGGDFKGDEKGKSSAEEIEKFRYVSGATGLEQRRKAKGVIVGVEKRKLPLSMRVRNEENREGNVRVASSGLFTDLLDVLKMVFGDQKENNGDADFLETAKKRGITFPRPRWWPPESADD